MQVIRTRSFATILRRSFLGFVVFLILLVAMAAAVFAVETPPQSLLTHVSSHELVYDKKCKVESLKLDNVECLVYYDDKHDVVWVVLFDGNLDITRIIAANDGKESYIWCRADVCL